MTEDHAEATVALHLATALGWSGPPRRPPQPPVAGTTVDGETWRQPSVRSFSPTPPHADVVAELLRSAYGSHHGRRAVPSAGGIYGLSLYCIPLEGGIPWILGLDGGCEELRGEPAAGDEIGRFVFHQFDGAGWLVIITFDVAAYTARYETRGYRYAMLEAGHLAQEILRLAQEASLATCPIGAFDDFGIRRALGLELSLRLPLYAAAIGFPQVADIP